MTETNDAESHALRVAVVHEWLVAYAGSERVVEQIRAAFPRSSLRTTIAAPDRLPVTLHDAETTFLQRVPRASAHHGWLLPLMPLAWRTSPLIGDVDVLISSSHACVRSVRVADGIPHLCYCHAPMRYAWDFTAERMRFPAAVRPLARALMAGARSWDRRTARRVTAFVANSSAVAERIGAYYGRAAQVIHPPVDTGFFTPDATEHEGFLFVGRLVAYKRADLVVEAFRGLPHALTVIGQGPLGDGLRASAPPNVRFLGSVDGDRLRAEYRRARALVFPADEDFGIAMAEAQACGTPVIGLAAGGALDIVDHGRTGWLCPEPTVAAIRRAVARAVEEELDAAAIRASAERFSEERFRTAIRAAAEELVALHARRSSRTGLAAAVAGAPGGTA